MDWNLDSLSDWELRDPLVRTEQLIRHETFGLFGCERDENGPPRERLAELVEQLGPV